MNNLTYVRQYKHINEREAVACLIDTLRRLNICKMSYVFKVPRILQIERVYEQ